MPKIRETKIENGVQFWPCNRCGEWFPKEGFYEDKRAKKWGIRGVCKKCHSIISIETRDKDKARKHAREWQQTSGYRHRPEVMERERRRALIRNHSLEARCRAIFNRAVKEGILQRPEYCPICGKKKKIEGHHDSYFRPLEVKWMCSLCHAEYHRRLRDGSN